LKDINLDVTDGQVLCLIGPSGSGKSTLLRCINQLERIDAGAIFVNDELVGYRRVGDYLYELNDAEIARQRHKIGMVFQRFNLFPHFTVLENICEAPMMVLKENPKDAQAHAEILLESVGLLDKRKAYPSELSGGQQQRVAIARALAMRPSVMLFDEPTSALDPELVGDVLDVMRTLAANGMTMIVVTHELTFARNVGDAVAFMDAGTIIEMGNPASVLSNPEHKRTRDFISAFC
jgi:polar amino acid transport system ATP-binding protein